MRTPVSLFVLFPDSQKDVGGLVCEGYIGLGTLKSTCVEKKGVVMGVSGSICESKSWAYPKLYLG